jgi:3-methyladenine DNA glycosylase AlkD
MAEVQEVMKQLQALARPDQLEGMSRYGMAAESRLGVRIPDLRRLARQIGRDHELALALWKTGVADARILAAMVADPEGLTDSQMEEWVVGIDSWDVCDQVCMNLFEKSPHAVRKIHEWSGREEQFVRRAAYALIACLAWHDKERGDREFIELLPLLEAGADDERNFVKKAVSWALRHIGKRNVTLNREAVAAASRIGVRGGKAARWIAADAIRELESAKVQQRLGGGG